MENAQVLFENENSEQSGLTLRLDYMVEDFLEFLQKENQEKLVGEENQ